jgi:UDP-N-acetylmuramyl tripeptide synthase
MSRIMVLGQVTYGARFLRARHIVEVDQWPTNDLRAEHREITPDALSPGRLNVFDGHGFRVILDYAHNPAGLKALGDVILKMRPRHGRVIGMINIPGDRRDEDMREMGALATRYFDEIVFREPGETGVNAVRHAYLLMTPNTFCATQMAQPIIC